MTYDDLFHALELVHLIEDRAIELLVAREQSFPGSTDPVRSEIAGETLILTWKSGDEGAWERSAKVPLRDVLLNDRQWLDLVEGERAARNARWAKRQAAYAKERHERELALFRQLRRKFEPEKGGEQS